MSVVLRCPSCGTTRETAGECEVCHQAQVAYFCPNHKPGQWLEGPTCPRCEVPAPPPTLARPALVDGWEQPSLRQAGGCLMRLVIIAVVALLAIALALYLLGRSLVLSSG